jgi:hypothetical protein
VLESSSEDEETSSSPTLDKQTHSAALDSNIQAPAPGAIQTFVQHPSPDRMLELRCIHTLRNWI